MKKWMLIAGILFGCFFCLKYGDVYAKEFVEDEPDTNIYLDADAIGKRIASKSAVADMHGVFVFRKKFIVSEEAYKQRQKQQQREWLESVLSKEQPELACRKWVDIVFKSDSDKYIRDIQEDENSSDVFIWITCLTISIGLLCVGFMIEDYKKRRKKFINQKQEREDEDYYNI